jgi:hypothetical protein
MTDQDKRAFMEEMKRTGVAFAAPVDDAQLAVYWEGLRDLDLDTLREAFADCRLSLAFFPRIVDLRDAEFGARERREHTRVQTLIAAAPEREWPTISEDQWQERWAALKRIAGAVPMKAHHGLEGDRCQCADHQRQRREASRGRV